MAAVNDPNYRYAEQSWEGDGTTVQFTINFDGGYIEQSDVVGYTVKLDPDTQLPDETTRTPVSITFISESGTEATVSIPAPVPTGTRLYIYRSTNKSSPLVSYSNNSMLTTGNLDLANKQAIFGIAEIMDGLNDSGLKLGQAVNQIIDTNTLVQNVYNQVIALLNESGIIGVTPLVWQFTGDGQSTDFPIAGADLNNASFYDVYVNGAGQEPTIDFTILPTTNSSPYTIRMSVAPATGLRCFVVLRGSAKPYTGGAPITSLRSPVTDIGTTFFVDKTVEFGFLRATQGASVVTIKNVPQGSDPTTTMGTGSYFSVAQRSNGLSTIVADTGVNLILPAGCIAQVRAVGSVISATCEDIDSNTWVLSGDLASAGS